VRYNHTTHTRVILYPFMTTGSKLYDSHLGQLAVLLGRNLLRFNTAPLGAVPLGVGARDLFPRIREDFKVKSSIPQGLPCGDSLSENLSAAFCGFMAWGLKVWEFSAGAGYSHSLAVLPVPAGFYKGE
jgi:hypothetical protein